MTQESSSDKALPSQSSGKGPKTAYISLWLPKPSETFVLREVVNLWKFGLPLQAFTAYGELKSDLSPEMAEVSKRVERLGVPFLKRLPGDIRYWLDRNPKTVWKLLREIPIRKWRSIEVGGENLWCFLTGFTLGRLFQERGIEHIHAVWANGPAMSAWVASRLTGIPFSFTGRAGDIYPQDGALREKIRDAAFVITDNMTNIKYLQGFADGNSKEKIHGVYNGVPLERHRDAAVKMTPPYKLLAVGRFDKIKAFPMLLYACGLLKKIGFAFHLTLVGSGWRKAHYKWREYKLGLSGLIDYPGFVTYDRITEMFSQADMFVMSSAVHRSGGRDGLPTVIMEAFMHRLPVVATDVCGIAEVVQDGVTGYLVPENDPPALARAIMKMSADRDNAVAMAERGRSLVSREFDQEKNHRKIFDLFVAASQKAKETGGHPTAL